MSVYNVFSLPSELLEGLTLRNVLEGIERPPSPPSKPTSSPAPPNVHGARACHVCLGAIFRDVEDQRAHYRSDWHRYNVKVRLSGGEPATESAFAKLIDALEDSLSGSASSSDDSESDSDKITTLVDKSKRTARSPSPSDRPTIPQSPLAWFHSAPSTQIGVYKALFPIGGQPVSFVDELGAMQNPTPEGRKWAMFMTAGGHFAGAIVRVSQAEEDREDDVIVSGKHKSKPKRPKPETEVLKHKTFHRYTTRRKQGGSQSLNDNAKGPAKSAGAQLRRYGEQALRDDIRNLLQEWAHEIEDCERIWIRASISNRRIFLGYDDAVISKVDTRLRTFPFPTRRPTQAELSRCLLELTKVKVTHFTEAELREQDDAYIASLPKPKPHPVPALPEPEKPKQPKLSKEEEQLRATWTRLLEMVIKGRLEPLKAFWSREETSLGGVNAPLPDWTGEKVGTLLQLASQAGAEEVVQWLLEDQRADPTIEVPLRGGNEDGYDDDHGDGQASETSDAPPAHTRGSRKTAYDLARTKEVRNVFRRCAATHPDWYDWFGAARVPSALSKTMEEEREEKRKARQKSLKQKLKEREARAREQLKERTPSPPPAPLKPETKPADPLAPRRLGGAAGSVEGLAGLSPEMRAKVERERRARAAEARLKAPTGR